MADYIVAIPARYASTRLPGKPLADCDGMPMIKRVALQALNSKAKRIIICIDDERVAQALQGVNVEVCMTSKDCKCGTDRIAEMLKKLNIAPETVVVNIQGDEPLINPEHIDKVANLLIDSGADMSTLCAEISEIKDVFDPNCVKVVMDCNGMALYFSRAPIPYERDNFKSEHVSELHYPHYHHIGIYGYKAKTVVAYSAMDQAEIEKCESLEQLRLLNLGYKIAVGITDRPPETGVDTADDLARINEILKRNH